MPPTITAGSHRLELVGDRSGVTNVLLTITADPAPSLTPVAPTVNAPLAGTGATSSWLLVVVGLVVVGLGVGAIALALRARRRP
jgi:LPXTG-motif cell wall-anchored protein